MKKPKLHGRDAYRTYCKLDLTTANVYKVAQKTKGITCKNCKKIMGIIPQEQKA